MSLPRLAYTTPYGRAFQGDSRHLLDSGVLEAGSIDLIFTSPPFALTRQKDYGNSSQDKYVEWLLTFVPGWQAALSDRGSLVLDLGGAYEPGAPRRSTYHFAVAVELARYLDLCQEFYWYNPAKLPGPAEWTNVQRVRVKDSVNLLLWFARDASRTGADNRRVLKRYSESMRSLLKNGYQIRKRPSNHDISSKFLADNRGAIPSNLLGFADDSLEQGSLREKLEGDPFEDQFDNILSVANTSSTDQYLQACRRHGIKPHNARFPKGLPAFFIEFLTEPGQLVLDPFAGSNTTGEVAESLGRKWLSCELDSEGAYAGTYVRSSAFRFAKAEFERGFSELPERNWHTTPKRAEPTSHTKPL